MSALGTGTYVRSNLHVMPKISTLEWMRWRTSPETEANSFTYITNKYIRDCVIYYVCKSHYHGNHVLDIVFKTWFPW